MSLVSVVFYTDAHRVAGALRLRERLAEALNDPLTDYLELNDVTVSKLVDPTRRSVQWPSTVTPKNEIAIVTLEAVTHESETTRVDKLTQKTGSQLGCIVGAIELYGTGHMRSVKSASEVLMSQLPAFFPVTDATLLLPAAIDSRLETPLALANRSRVRALSLL